MSVLFESGQANYVQEGVTAVELGSSYPWESLTREKLKTRKTRFSLLLIFHFSLFLQFLFCFSVHSLATFLLGLYFYAHNLSTVSVTSACATATYPEKPMATATGSWVVFGELLLNIFAVFWNCLKLCYVSSKLSTSEDAPAFSELRAFHSQMSHSKVFSQLGGKSVKLQKAVVGISSLNDTLIFWFHMGEWYNILKYESPSCC